MGKQSKNGQYPLINHSSRYHRLTVTHIYNRVVFALVDRSGYETVREGREAGYWRQDLIYSIGLEERDPLEQFARLVVYSDHRQECTLTDVTGIPLTIPNVQCTDEELVAAYEHWLKCDEEEVNKLDARILEFTASPTPPHMVPHDELTEEQKSDPNS